MKIAIACQEDRVSPVFDVSNRMCLIELDGDEERNRSNITLIKRDPFERAQEVSSMGVEILICGAVSRVLRMALAGAGIEVIGFICGDIETVLGAFLRGQLMNGHFSMPGCFGQQQRLHFRQRRGKR